jgi:hypothetical protein
MAFPATLMTTRLTGMSLAAPLFRKAILLCVPVVVSGCMLNPIYLPGKYSISGGTSDGFGIALAPSRYQELGGKDSVEFTVFIQDIATKNGLCPRRTRVTDVQGLWGYMSISVQCVKD